MGKGETVSWDEFTAEIRARPGAAEEIAARTEATLASLQLAKMRELRLVTQVKLAKNLGKTQAAISRIERSRNLNLSTLAEYVGGLGGHIEINAVFTNEVIPLTKPGPAEHAPLRALGTCAPAKMPLDGRPDAG